jgi:DNA polymerase III epsilon subunit-like protein
VGLLSASGVLLCATQLVAVKEGAGMVVRVIDIETTGTDPETDAIIEIASVDVLASL